MQNATFCNFGNTILSNNFTIYDYAIFNSNLNVNGILNAYTNVNISGTLSNAQLYLTSNAAFWTSNALSNISLVNTSNAAFWTSNALSNISLVNTSNAAFWTSNALSNISLVNTSNTAFWTSNALSNISLVKTSNAAFWTSNSLLNYLPLSGGTITGIVSMQNATFCNFGNTILSNNFTIYDYANFNSNLNVNGILNAYSNINISGPINNCNISFNQSLYVTAFSTSNCICSNANFGNNLLYIGASTSYNSTMSPEKALLKATGGKWSSSNTNSGPYNFYPWSANLNNAGFTQQTYVYSSQNYVFGDWIQIQFPQNVGIETYSIGGYSNGYASRLPIQWTLLGSTDTSNFSIIENRTLAPSLQYLSSNSAFWRNYLNSNSTYTDYQCTPSNNSGFSCFRWVFNQVDSSSNNAIFVEIPRLSITYNACIQSNCSINNYNYGSTYNYGNVVNFADTAFNNNVIFSCNIIAQNSLSLSNPNLQSLNSINNCVVAFDSNIYRDITGNVTYVTGSSNLGATYSFSNKYNYQGNSNFKVSCSSYFNSTTLPWFPFFNNPGSYVWSSASRSGGGYGGTIWNNTQSNATTYDTNNMTYVYGDWLQIQYPSPVCLLNYTLSGLSSNQTPTNWFTYGSLDNSNFKLLDEIATPSTYWNTNTSYQSTNIPQGLYSYYRWIFTSNQGFSTVSVGGISMNFNNSVNKYTNYSPCNVVTGDMVQTGYSFFNANMNVNALINSSEGYIGSIQPGAHYPSESNVFLNWLQNTTSTLYNSWWSRANNPISSIVPNSGISCYGTNGINHTPFSGMVNIADGRTILIPFNACNVGIYNSYTNTYTSGALNIYGSNAFGGGVLLPNGNICMAPYSPLNSNIVQYNPYANNFQFACPIQYPFSSPYTFSNATSRFNGAVLIGDGSNVMLTNTGFISYFSYNYNANTFGRGANVGNYLSNSIPNQTGVSTSGGILLQNGNICIIPNGLSNMVIQQKTTSAQYVSTIAASNFGSGVMLPNGNVMMVPRSNNTNIGIYYANCNTDVQITTIPLSSTVSVKSAYSGCSMLADGRVFLTPLCASNAGIYDYNGPPGTFYTLPSVSNTFTTNMGGYNASILLPNGNILMTPSTSNNNSLTIVSGFGRPSKDLCYHPIYNRGGFINY